MNENDPKRVAIVRHVVRKAQMSLKAPTVLIHEMAVRITKEGTLPTALEQADLLVRWLGENLVARGELQGVASRMRLAAWRHSAVVVLHHGHGEGQRRPIVLVVLRPDLAAVGLD